MCINHKDQLYLGCFHVVVAVQETVATQHLRSDSEVIHIFLL
jgi:hypothetical protein